MRLLKGLCKSITKRFLRRIAADITAGKTSRVVCEDIKMCKSKPGMCIGNSRDSFPDSLPVKGKLLTDCGSLPLPLPTLLQTILE